MARATKKRPAQTRNRVVDRSSRRRDNGAHYSERLAAGIAELNARLDRLENILAAVVRITLRGESNTMAKWEDVQAAIAAQTTVSAGVLSFIGELKAKLQEFAAQEGGPSQEEMQAAVDDLTRNADKLAAAVVHNTPAASTDPLIVGSPVPGQPATHYPDGVEKPPFNAPKSNPDMSTPKPQGNPPQTPNDNDE